MVKKPLELQPQRGSDKRHDNIEAIFNALNDGWSEREIRDEAGMYFTPAKVDDYMKIAKAKMKKEIPRIIQTREITN